MDKIFEMGKKSKSKSKPTSSSISNSSAPAGNGSNDCADSNRNSSSNATAGKSSSSKSSSSSVTQQKKSSTTTQSSPGRDDAHVFQSHLDINKLCSQFDSLIASSPEEGIQAVRDLYLNVLKKKIINQKRILFLQDKKQSLQTDIARNKDLITEENNAYLQATSQKDKLQSLCDCLTEKKDTLLQEARVRAEEEKNKQKQRTTDLIGETQEISATLQKYDTLRHEYAADNDRLKDKLRVVLDNYSAQENDFNATMERQVALIAAATEKLEEQSGQLDKEVLGSGGVEEGLAEALKEEKVLKAEVREKAARFEEFQAALTASNESFQEFKQRMEEQSAAIASLEKENKQLSEKKDRTEQAIKDMSAEIVSSRQVVFDTTQKQIAKLSQLSAALKAEVEELTANQNQEEDEA